MTDVVENVVYQWEKADVCVVGVSAGGSCTMEASFDGVNFTPAMTLPLDDGELFAQVQLRNMYFRFIGIVGTVTFRANAKISPAHMITP